jgi:hypothetical protein
VQGPVGVDVAELAHPVASAASSSEAAFDACLRPFLPDSTSVRDLAIDHRTCPGWAVLVPLAQVERHLPVLGEAVACAVAEAPH